MPALHSNNWSKTAATIAAFAPVARASRLDVFTVKKLTPS
jgi:hypothetical protein